eukprot:gnl/MRDRNA2_/MRDRNA2_135266_c0_seq1.p1 gnl/MRDRNA2_/MRDRNA2_135266_c0~~gnl/MRDRNA2_/MRDRNA2_135266_c0_seq1.p1  ORF type:complete len:706 (-),score=127.08 gnl/MRDRNA2_/MRDRNA2_135266_c0_seq1:26-2143(-)
MSRHKRAQTVCIPDQGDVLVNVDALKQGNHGAVHHSGNHSIDEDEAPDIVGPSGRYPKNFEAIEQSPLHDMASLGRVHDVEHLIQAGADREKADAWGRTPMHLSAALGHDAVVRLLVKLGAHLNLNDSTGQTPLHLAALHGQRRVIATLLELKAQINGTTDSGRTALHLAVEGGQSDICEQLVKLNANAEARDSHRDTPLTLSVRMGHTATLESLIASKCDMVARDEEGATPLHLATCKQRLRCCEVLVGQNASVEMTDKYGLTPLHWAARNGEPEAVKTLIKLGANACCRTGVEQQTPLHLAAQAEELEVLEALVRASADKEAQDSRGYTALHVSVEQNRPDALAQLLRLGASREIKTRSGETALHLACHQNKPPLIVHLMRGGSDVNATGRRGMSPLHICADRGFLQCANTLLDPLNRAEARGASDSSKLVVKVNAHNDKQQTPLHLAAWAGRVDIIELLVRNVATVDVQDVEQSTPLNLAVSKNHDMAVQMLLRLNADPQRRNRHHLMPLQQACAAGAYEVAKTLAEMRMVPGADEEPWRRPMALAKYYGHQAIVDYFFKPCPKNRLVLNLPRAVSTECVSVTFGQVVCEPALTELTIECALKGPDRGSTGADSFAADMVSETKIEEDDWLSGKTVQVSGLKENTAYLLRLVGINDAGTTIGDPVRVTTKSAADAGRSAKGRAAKPKSTVEEKAAEPEKPSS